MIANDTAGDIERLTAELENQTSSFELKESFQKLKHILDKNFDFWHWFNFVCEMSHLILHDRVRLKKVFEGIETRTQPYRFVLFNVNTNMLPHPSNQYQYLSDYDYYDYSASSQSQSHILSEAPNFDSSSSGFLGKNCTIGHSRAGEIEIDQKIMLIIQK